MQGGGKMEQNCFIFGVSLLFMSAKVFCFDVNLYLFLYVIDDSGTILFYFDAN